MIKVLLHKKTGQLYELFESVLGPALTCVDFETEEFTNWHDWTERGLFYFNDMPEFNLNNFEDLGEL